MPQTGQSICQKQCSRQELPYQKGVLINFTKLRGKHLCRSQFFNKVTKLRPINLLKRDSDTGAFLLILRNLSEHLFHRILSVDCF